MIFITVQNYKFKADPLYYTSILIKPLHLHYNWSLLSKASYFEQIADHTCLILLSTLLSLKYRIQLPSYRHHLVRLLLCAIKCIFRCCQQRDHVHINGLKEKWFYYISSWWVYSHIIIDYCYILKGFNSRK